MITALPDAHLRLHNFLESSQANGPGWRAVIWVQGCTLGCPGCFNPQTHPKSPGSSVPVAELAGRILQLEAHIEGITISGGEPLQQIGPVTALLRQVRQDSGLSVILFTGYTWEEIQSMPAAPGLLEFVDVLLAGRFMQELRVGQGLVGSSNKTLHFLTGRYSGEDLSHVPTTELILAPGGEILASGIDPILYE